jgi:aminoglycoside phosphotransferase (APT) family kinase protein
MTEAAGGTIPVREGEEIVPELVLAFLRASIPDLPTGELRIRQFPTGASNLTYHLRVGEWQGVLRRPPLGPVPPRAHDMVREARLLERVHPVFPLAPRVLAVCEDPSLLGAPFHVTEYRSGSVIAFGFPAGVEVTPALSRRAGAAVVHTLVELHDVDATKAGLADLGRPEGFLERQVRGWIGRWEGAKTEEIAAVGPLTRWLAARVPESPSPTVIHNDYHLKNLLFDSADPARIVAVLDWEMATIGDPLMDLAISLSYWLEDGDPPALTGFLSTVTTSRGFPKRREFAELYAKASGRDLGEMGWYLPFAYFKLAVILQQIYARWVRGQTRDPRFEGMGVTVRAIVEHAWALAGSGAAL